jgi:hypothetical protein
MSTGFTREAGVQKPWCPQVADGAWFEALQQHPVIQRLGDGTRCIIFLPILTCS